MKCRHLTQSGHCAEVEHRPPCTARLCGPKNEARPLHVANLTRMATRCDRVEYLERLDSAEGRMAGMMVRAEYLEWWERRRNGATAAPEAAGGAQTGATHAERSEGAEAPQNTQQGN